MPIYEYECRPCKERFERLLSYKESDKPQRCVKCGKEARKQVSRTSFALKGNGWASDGYAGRD